MNVLIAAASFPTKISGIQRHAFNAVRCLLQQPEITALHLVVAPWQTRMVEQAALPKDVRLFVHVGKLNRDSISRNFWYYRELPRIARQLAVDITHFTYPMPINAAAFHCPTALTLHDLYPFDTPTNFGFPKFLFNRLVLRQSLRNADSIACVSESTLLKLRDYTPYGIWRKSIRIYNCVEPARVCSERSPIPGWNSEPFLLCIAQHRRNKNVPLLIKAYEWLLRAGQIRKNTKLVIVGISGPETPAIKELIANAGLSDAVHLMEGLPESDLQWCYRNCEALVSPSSIEGFGLPVAEGMLAGCRVVCSDIPAHREIGGGICHFVPVREDAEVSLAYAISAALREAKPEPVPLPHLSAPVLAKQYIALYRRLIVSTAPARSKPEKNAFGAASSSSSLLEDHDLALQGRGK
jgi:glycosyltransferase involved in cell wall biosynthesis